MQPPKEHYKWVIPTIIAILIGFAQLYPNEVKAEMPHYLNAALYISIALLLLGYINIKENALLKSQEAEHKKVDEQTKEIESLKTVIQNLKLENNKIGQEIKLHKQQLGEQKEQYELSKKSVDDRFIHQGNAIKDFSENIVTGVGILRDIILPEFFGDKESVSKIVIKLYNYHYNSSQLEKFGLDRNLLDAFNVYTHEMKLDTIRKNNPNIK
ncbi:hypothetical protein F5148DRAFT_1286231 [Russula earlei]|uniref:Uncharacterized protein n=1 Tax=Russula earlei TaxID=71964 RepID=A0ACC0U691_9AGAM|nr:hypothetical protein F5148DRAFT_1286231 [Russula earlei]